jgi:hypothetical protein
MRLTTSMYTTELRPTHAGERAISRPQIELIATTVSKLNSCAY